MTEIKKTNRDKGMKLVQIIEDGKDGAVHRVHVTANAFAVVTQKGGDSRLRTIKF